MKDDYRYLPKNIKRKKMPLTSKDFLRNEINYEWKLPKNIIIYMGRNKIKNVDELLKTNNFEDLWIQGVLHPENIIEFVQLLVDYRIYHRFKNP